MPPSLVRSWVAEKPLTSTADAITLRAQEVPQRIAVLRMWLRRVFPWVKRTGRSGRDNVLRKPERGVRKRQLYEKNFAGRWLVLHTSAARERTESKVRGCLKGTRPRKPPR